MPSRDQVAVEVLGVAHFLRDKRRVGSLDAATRHNERVKIRHDQTVVRGHTLEVLKQLQGRCWGKDVVLQGLLRVCAAEGPEKVDDAFDESFRCQSFLGCDRVELRHRFLKLEEQLD